MRYGVAARPMRGFTLVEVLVALFILSVLAMLSWRALDGMSLSLIHI